MRALITGVTGFAGSHLADYLLGLGNVEVFGTYRVRSRMDNVRHLAHRIRLVECDLCDATAVHRLISLVRPDRIFHLAAQSFVPTSWLAPSETFRTNVEGQINLLEAVRRSAPEARVQIACSSEEYGLVQESELPISEDQPLRPLSPYGVSKVAQDLLGFQYHQSFGLFVVRTRAFNHTGPRRGETFAESNFARQIARAELGLTEPALRVGNLDARRDYTDVRDTVRAYWLSLERGQPGEVYNIATGHTHPLREIAERLIAMARVPLEVRLDPTRLRPSDVPVLQGDARRFAAVSGWSPQIPLEQTLADLLDDWRQRLR